MRYYHRLRSQKKLIELIDNLKSNKSPDPDAINLRVLKEIKYEVAEQLTKICHLSLKTAMILEDLKVADLVTIFLKGSRGDLGNYKLVNLIQYLYLANCLKLK